MTKLLFDKFKESLISTLPVTILIIILNFTFLHMPIYEFLLFIIGFIFLVFGVTLFSLGADISMIPMGKNLGEKLMTKKNLVLLLGSSFLVGFLITIAEPDLMVLAEKFPSLNKWVLILTVGTGVGLCLMISTWRVVYKVKLKGLLIIGYLLIFAVAILMHFVDESFVPLAFDSGGVTTGPITVPFLLAFGLGISSRTKKKNDDNFDDNFGTVAICSMGPILAILILKVAMAALSSGSCLPAQDSVGDNVNTTINVINNFSDMFKLIVTDLVEEFKNVGLPILLIAILFTIYQTFLLRIDIKSLVRIFVGLLITYVGLVLFLSGATFGFMNVGTYMGNTFASSNIIYLLIPLGAIIGFVVVLAEPSVHVLTKQVEDITNGSINRNKILFSLAIGVGISIALSMVRIIWNISIWWFIVPGYAISLVLMFFVPDFFSSIAFDSGGVASGPLTSTFILPLSMGVCATLYASDPVVSTINSFGVVAFVAMAPLITIQLVGFNYKLKTMKLERAMKKLVTHDEADDVIITFKKSVKRK